MVWLVKIFLSWLSSWSGRAQGGLTPPFYILEKYKSKEGRLLLLFLMGGGGGRTQFILVVQIEPSYPRIFNLLVWLSAGPPDPPWAKCISEPPEMIGAVRQFLLEVFWGPPRLRIVVLQSGSEVGWVGKIINYQWFF